MTETGTIGVIINAHWVDTFGVLHIEWDWSGTLDDVTLGVLNEHPSALDKTSLRSVDNLSQAGKLAVFIIEELIVKIDDIARSTINLLKTTHTWEELVRNAVT